MHAQHVPELKILSFFVGHILGSAVSHNMHVPQKSKSLFSCWDTLDFAGRLTTHQGEEMGQKTYFGVFPDLLKAI